VCVRMGGRRYDCSARQLVSVDYEVKILAYLVFERISAELYCGLVDRSHQALLLPSCSRLLVLRSDNQLQLRDGQAD
jgi:hypothetical protein